MLGNRGTTSAQRIDVQHYGYWCRSALPLRPSAVPGTNGGAFYFSKVLGAREGLPLSASAMSQNLNFVKRSVPGP